MILIAASKFYKEKLQIYLNQMGYAGDYVILRIWASLPYMAFQLCGCGFRNLCVVRGGWMVWCFLGKWGYLDSTLNQDSHAGFFYQNLDVSQFALATNCKCWKLSYRAKWLTKWSNYIKWVPSFDFSEAWDGGNYDHPWTLAGNKTYLPFACLTR